MQHNANMCEEVFYLITVVTLKDIFDIVMILFQWFLII